MLFIKFGLKFHVGKGKNVSSLNFKQILGFQGVKVPPHKIWDNILVKMFR